jgi:hypothetical protein
VSEADEGSTGAEPTEIVGCRVPRPELAALDRLAAELDCSRSRAIRAAVMLAASSDSAATLAEVEAGLPDGRAWNRPPGR